MHILANSPNLLPITKSGHTQSHLAPGFSVYLKASLQADNATRIAPVGSTKSVALTCEFAPRAERGAMLLQ